MKNELPNLPARAANAHKGTTGTVAVLGGNCTEHVRMIGAPAFVAMGALRAGCGLVKILTPAPIIGDVLSLIPSAIGVALRVDDTGAVIPSFAAELLDKALLSAACLVVGPGMGDHEATLALSLRAVQQEQVPVVVDADAINALARVPELSRDFRARAILTPHPGEYRRLADSLKIDLDPVHPASREKAASALSLRLGCIVVLKGHQSVVSNGLETWTCTHGNPCLATAGTGDILAGVIAGLVAQFGPEPHNPLIELAAKRLGKGIKVTPHVLSLFDIARIAVQVHARAGDVWAEVNGASTGLLASELGEFIPGLIDEMQGN